MNKLRLASLERAVKAQQEDLSPADYLAGLRYHAATGHLPDGLDCPRIAEKVFKARAMLHLARTGAGAGTIKDLRKKPAPLGKQQQPEDDYPDPAPPPELTAYAKYKEMGFPGDYKEWDQGIFLDAYRRAHGALGDLARWSWALLRDNIVREYWGRQPQAEGH